MRRFRFHHLLALLSQAPHPALIQFLTHRHHHLRRAPHLQLLGAEIVLSCVASRPRILQKLRTTQMCDLRASTSTPRRTHQLKRLPLHPVLCPLPPLQEQRILGLLCTSEDSTRTAPAPTRAQQPNLTPFRRLLPLIQPQPPVPIATHSLHHRRETAP